MPIFVNASASAECEARQITDRDIRYACSGLAAVNIFAGAFGTKSREGQHDIFCQAPSAITAGALKPASLHQ
ncbi:hypothetical protein MEA186_31851 [Mesorhizobium amorphae CCNWGS0123]|uniref:Uncharacterized protein n=1 Tax=Mesorhizobium amorphae CCNWGS0123 TaxID=1082933 RepID=G6YK36_9HYPH|nr:hypothetical protein MEA186_31851 [Mesorhizobium amorphae CCNWGS0123]